MSYNVIITERAEKQLEQRINYLVYQLNNKEAGRNLLSGIGSLYDRLEDNPWQFTDCRDLFLKTLGYKEVLVMNMKYIVIFRIEDNDVYVLGIFHQLENYKVKL